MKNTKKGFVWPALIIVAVLALGLGGYFYSKNKQSSQIVQAQPQAKNTAPANWKTYTNTEYGFQFQYPAVLPINEGNGGYYEYDVCLQPGASAVYGDSCTTWDPAAGSKARTLQVVVIDKNAQVKTYADDLSKSGNFSLMKAENSAYIFAFMSDKDQAETLAKIFGTFKAIPIQNSVSAEWKTYTNNEYGFQLTYPAFYGNFVKVGVLTEWSANSHPLPSKSASIDIKMTQSDSPTLSLFSDIGGVATNFDFDKEQFFTTGNSGQHGDMTRSYLEKKYLNGNLYYQTTSGEGQDGWWGRTDIYFIFDSKNKSIVTLQTGSNPNTYNKGPKVENIFGTFKFIQ